MPNNDAFENLLRQRHQEAALEEARAREEQIARQERQARLNTLKFQFQQSVGQLIAVAAHYQSRLQGVAFVHAVAEPMRWHVDYERTGGTAGVASARLDFQLLESGEVRIKSTLGRSNTKQLSDLTHPVLAAEVQAFVTAAMQ